MKKKLGVEDGHKNGDSPWDVDHLEDSGRLSLRLPPGDGNCPRYCDSHKDGDPHSLVTIL